MWPFGKSSDKALDEATTNISNIVTERANVQAVLQFDRLMAERYGTCDKCGGVFARETMVEGAAEVRMKKPTLTDLVHYGFGYSGEEYIYHPIYCKEHAPKVKK